MGIRVVMTGPYGSPEDVPAAPRKRQIKRPLLGCLLASFEGRAAFLDNAVRLWSRMTYEPRELVIVNDDPAADPDRYAGDPRVSYLKVPRRLPLGAKLNIAADFSEAPFLVKLDDDDWYSESYLARAITEVLLKKDPERVILYPASFPVLLAETGEVLLVEGGLSGLGTGMLFSRRLWREWPFREDVESGIDSRFVADRVFVRAYPPRVNDLMYVRHGRGHLYRTVGVEPVESYFRRHFKPFPGGLEKLIPAAEIDFYRKLTCKISLGRMPV